MDRPDGSLLAPAARGRAAGLALAAVALVVCSIAIYPPLMDIAWVRSTAAPTWFGFALAALLAVLAIRRDTRNWVRSIAAFTLVFVGVSIYAFFGLARLPQDDGVPLHGARLPAVTLRDQDNRPVDLQAAATAGPTLLVFYRGFW
jgi:hypothetical protein